MNQNLDTAEKMHNTTFNFNKFEKVQLKDTSLINPTANKKMINTSRRKASQLSPLSINQQTQDSTQ